MAVDEAWAAELTRLGGSVEQEAAAARYLEMLDALQEDSEALTDSSTAAAVLWSLHPIESNGVYETVYATLEAFEEEAFVSAALEVLPQWLERHGDHEAIQWALGPFAWDAELQESFAEGVGRLDAPKRELVARTVVHWAEVEEEPWAPLAEAVRGAGSDGAG